LAPKHRPRNLGSVGEMGETTFVDGDARDVKPVDQLRPQFQSDLVIVAAQRNFLVLKIVIGVA